MLSSARLMSASSVTAKVRRARDGRELQRGAEEARDGEEHEEEPSCIAAEAVPHAQENSNREIRYEYNDLGDGDFVMFG
ncbi:hypothetical protein ONZ43_g4572 [Nemania bipapillata]|uniref:Uncharacterized protein n=1 Tax=Nemania bipapillata TaxID=110536 RepID=A0ACC2IKX4_9PEZI|nr:hypothetical protein ONZ43_g4572 [Nemania bipapillata]